MKKISLLLCFVILVMTLFAISVFAAEENIANEATVGRDWENWVTDPRYLVDGDYHVGSAGRNKDGRFLNYYLAYSEERIVSKIFIVTNSSGVFPVSPGAFTWEEMRTINFYVEVRCYDANGNQIHKEGFNTYDLDKVTVYYDEEGNPDYTGYTVNVGCKGVARVELGLTCDYDNSKGLWEVEVYEHTCDDTNLIAEAQEDGSINYVCNSCGKVKYVVNNSLINGEYYMGTDKIVFENGKMTALGNEYDYTYNVTTGIVDTTMPGTSFTVRDGKLYFNDATPLHTHDDNGTYVPETQEDGSINNVCQFCGEVVFVINNAAINGEYFLGTDKVVFADGVLTAMGGEFTYTYNVTTGMVDTNNAGIYFQVLDGVVYFKGAQPLHQHTGEGYAAEEQEDGSINYVCTFCDEVQYVVNNAAINGTYYMDGSELVFADGVLTIDGETTLNYTYNVTTGMVDTDNAAINFTVRDGKVYFKGATELHQADHAEHDASIIPTYETFAPTCSEAGYTEYYCYCGYSFKVEGEPALGGECDWLFTGYDEYNMPTCDIEGLANYECLVCGATKQETAYHRILSFVSDVEGQAPTCTEYGYSIFACYWCDAMETRKVAPKHSYDKDTENSVTPTCTTGGKDVFICSGCGDSYTEELPANGHNFNYWWGYEIVTPPTCTEDGENLYTCYNCGATETGAEPATGHRWINGEINTDTHTAVQTCGNGCGSTQTVSTLGWEEDPITITIPGSFTANVNKWVYYTFTHVEGYVTFTFESDNNYNVNAMIKDTREEGAYATQYFWGGETWTAELMADATYVLAISARDENDFEVAVTSTFVEADVPDVGEVPEKPIEMEGLNYGYASTGKVWYTIEVPIAGTVTITVDGSAVVSYGTDPSVLTAYSAPFTCEYAYTTYYILVESEAEATIVVNAEAPKGSTENPYDLIIGENVINVTTDTWYILPIYNAGTYTFTVNSADVSFGYGEFPSYPAMTFCSGELSYSTDANPKFMYNGNYYFLFNSSLTITVSYSAPVIEPEEPDDEVGENIGSIEVTTENTYGFNAESDEVDNPFFSYTADKAGKYSFYAPAGLGFWSKSSFEIGLGSQPEIGFYDNEYGYYVTVELAAGEVFEFTVGSTTKDTWTISVYYAEAHTHEYTIVASEDSTCTVKGYIAYECSCGENYVETLELAAHTETEIPMVRPTPSKTGYTAGVECSECGAIIKAPVAINVTEKENGKKEENTEFRIMSASLTLQENVSMNYKVLIANGYNYETAYMVFVFLGNEYVETNNYYEMSEDRFVFNFDKTNPQFMNENIAAYLYAETSEGEYTVVNLAEYSVKQYAVNQINKGDADLTTVISDVITYGAAVQQYLGYKTDELVTDAVAAAGCTLTPTAFAGITGSVVQKAEAGTVEATTAWKSASLSMGSTTELVVKFAAASANDLEGLKIKVVVDGYDEPLFFDASKCSSEVNTNGDTRYVFNLGVVRAYEFANKITFTFERDGEQVGGTLEYSINTYLQNNYQKTEADGFNANTINVIKALYTYGASVAAYSANN